MDLFELFILAVGLSMDAFAVAISKGLSLRRVSARDMIITGAWFGGFQALMPLLGYDLGHLFAGTFTRYAPWIAFVLLVFLGTNMLRESGNAERVDAGLGAKTMALMAVATSVDAFAVGVSLAFLNINIWTAISVIGVVTFAFSAAGIKIGSVFGARYRSKAEIFGGVVLILIGTKILLDGLGIL